MHVAPPLRVPLCALTLACASAPAAAAGQLPLGFVVEKIGADWENPVSVAFLSNDRMLVGEKRGRIWYLEHETKRNVALDLELEVLNLLDRGLLCVTADPGFDANGWVWLLYAVDPEADGIDGNKEAYCRLERWTLAYDASGDLVADPASRLDLIGDVWSTGVPSCHYSHAVGTLRFFSDGTLVASAGDGAHYDNVDLGGQDPECFGAGRFGPDQDIGAFRSQYPASLSGKILRLDPATGLGLADNPWFDGDPGSIESRTWARGLRNPFRFGLVPGTGPREAIFVCDVGWNVWEEVNLARGGENFGWPCREGKATTPYEPHDPQGFCASLVETPPALAWHHNVAGTIGFTGNCASGAVVYTGTSYPPVYRDALFFCDYGKSWIRCATLDASLGVASILPFGSGMDRPIDLQTDPSTGDLVYISFLGVGEIRRIRFIGTNQPPVAVASLAPTWGPSPLKVDFEALYSYDPEDSALTYAWDFDDGTTSNAIADPHTFTDSQNHDVVLTLTDDVGNTTTQHWLVSPGNTPPQVVSVSEPPAQFAFHDGVPFAVAGTVADAEDDAAGIPVGAKWTASLIQFHQEHPDFAVLNAASGEMTLASQGPGSHYEIELTATDSRGLSASTTMLAFDDAAAPAPHLVSVSDVTPRVGQRVGAVAHVEYANLGFYEKNLTLNYDWGDGHVDSFVGLRHQEDTTPGHTYGTIGDYTLTLTAGLAGYQASVAEPIHVAAEKPAVAVFTPVLNAGFIQWDVQLDVAQSIRTAMQAQGVDCETFSYDAQQELVDWMAPYLDDDVRDVLVLLDAAPAAVFSGQVDGSLAELWIEGGNGLVWSGYEPFDHYIQPTGVLGATGGLGAERVLDAPTGSFPCRGSGSQLVTPLGESHVPSLPATWYADFALRPKSLDPAQWRIDRLYAEEDPDHDTDAVMMRHAGGGFYAQIFAAEDVALDRASALTQFLKNYAKVASWGRPVKVPPPGD